LKEEKMALEEKKINWNELIETASREKGIEKSVFVDAMKEAILKAAKKVFGEEREFEVAYNEETGEVELYQYMTVVEKVKDPLREISLEQARMIDEDPQIGDELGIQIFYLEQDKEKAREQDERFGDILKVKTARNAFGRIAAQVVKQVVLQKIGEAERLMVYREFKDRVGEIATGLARRFDRGNIIVDLGKAEAVLPLREQCPRESYRSGDRIQALIKEVSKEAKGHQIILSRADSRFVVKLFEKEVPEIYEGIVKIVSIAREPGERTKIAVSSSDSDVDPVGACVGMKGSRVQAVVQELKGEKIDIIPYSTDLAKYVCAAVAPAVVQRVLIDEKNHQIELIVPDDQLSLAIGRRGQNVKLASKLVGWAIEVHGETYIAEQKKKLGEFLSQIEGLDPSTMEYLFKLGYHSPDNILNADEEDIAAVPGLNLALAQAIQQKAYELKVKMREEEEASQEVKSEEAQ
jgi:N utilization substance protein A